MGLIYFLSAQSDLNSGLGTIDLIGRKLIHAAEYGLLFGLWWRAFDWRWPVAAAVIAIGWAISDEFHQLSVKRFKDPGRDGRPGERYANRLKNRVWLHTLRLDDTAQRGFDLRQRPIS